MNQLRPIGNSGTPRGGHRLYSCIKHMLCARAVHLGSHIQHMDLTACPALQDVCSTLISTPTALSTQLGSDGPHTVCDRDCPVLGSIDDGRFAPATLAP